VQYARLIVIASPDGFQVRRVLELVRAKNPGIATIVRTHSANELAYLTRQGVDRAVMGELELALEMADYALRRLGVDDERCKSLLQKLRDEGAAESAWATYRKRSESHAFRKRNSSARTTGSPRTAGTGTCDIRRRSPTSGSCGSRTDS
jgi:voltage-gated potassium channel Kch